MSNLTPLMQHSAGSFSQCNKIRNKNNRHEDWKGRNKSIPFTDGCLCRKSQEINKKKQLICEFSKIVGHKINIQKSIVFLYSGNEQMHTD